MTSFYAQKFSQLQIELEGEILWVYLNNPELSNAISLEMVDSLTQVLTFADFDSQVRVIVIGGRGSVFCAGGDIKAMSAKTEMFAGDPNELRMRYLHGIQRIPKCLEALSTPVIAMVDGAAVGAGCDLTMMCDLRVGSEKAKFGETFVKVGLVPGDGGSYFLQRVVGFAKAMQMTLTGDLVSGKAACEFGLTNYYSESVDLHSTTKKLAQKISANAPIAVQMSKKCMKVAYNQELGTVLELAAAFQGIAQRTDDHFIALEAFKNKTAPRFSGK